MIICLPYCIKDKHLAQKLVDWIYFLEPDFDAKFLLVRGEPAEPVIIPNAPMIKLLVYPDDRVNDWPFSCNRMFNKAAKEIEGTSKEPFLWLEPDTVVLKAGWFEAIKAAYAQAEKNGKRFLGDRVQVNDVPLHMSGVGVYPGQISWYAGTATMATDVAWDVYAKDQIVPLAEWTKLICHNWRHEAIDSPSKLANLMEQHPEMVLFHSDKSGCMIDQLRALQPRVFAAPLDPSIGAAIKHINLGGGSGLAGYALEQEKRREPSPAHFQQSGVSASAPPEDERNRSESPSGNGKGQLAALPAQSTAETLSCDIFIKTYAPDYQWLQLCLQAIERYCIGFNEIIVVSSDDGAPVGTRERLIVRADESADGYLCQQIAKLYADMDSRADYILHVDCDVLFTEPTRPEDFFFEGKIDWLYTPYEKTDTPWKRITEKFLKQKVAFEFMRRAPQMIPRWLYPKLREYAYHLHEIALSEYIKNQPYREFSEFNALGAFAYYYHSSPFHWINTEEWPNLPAPKARQFRSWDGTGVYQGEIKTILDRDAKAKGEAGIPPSPVRSFKRRKRKGRKWTAEEKQRARERGLAQWAKHDQKTTP